METPEQLLARIRAARSVYSTSAAGWTAAEAYRTIQETCSQLTNMNDPNKWTSIDEAIEDVQLAHMATDDWCDPTDSAWWAECPQIGDLDPCDLSVAWERWMGSRAAEGGAK